MIDLAPVVRSNVSADFVADLAHREIALWLRSDTLGGDDTEALVELLQLPWRMVLLETLDKGLISHLDQHVPNETLVRKRGYIQIVEENPAQISLPQQCLPIYLLNGNPSAPTDPFQDQLRRMTMLDGLRQSGVRRLFIISLKQDTPLPADLANLCAAGFRSYVTIATDGTDIEFILANCREIPLPLVLLDESIATVVDQVLALYRNNHPDQGHIIRLRRSEQGDFATLDVASVDDPERPILSQFDLIREADLTPLLPSDISTQVFTDFFRDPTLSWEPYAAGLPWERHGDAKVEILDILRMIETEGAEQSTFATIISESGSGGTTFAHDIAWHCATQGYPVLIAHQSPFVPDSLATSNFLNRVRQLNLNDADEAGYCEVPWLIVFDRAHWEHRSTEIRSFFRDIRRNGRPVCILTVTGPRRGMSIFDSYPERELANLTHALSNEDARDLGSHLNKHLQVHGRRRMQSEWDQFHDKHRVGADFSMFWIALSFWIRDLYDLTETIQERIFRAFKEHVTDEDIQQAILDIAALSAERIPTPERVLVTPKEKEWPVPRLLEDSLPDLADLGLFQFNVADQPYWTLVHDILGQQLLNALFFDIDLRQQLGFENAKELIDLRLMILRRISERPEIGQPPLKNLGEAFATSIFKVDPDHGRASFAQYWREVIPALDKMSASLRNSSRIFRHHTAISRRRIAKLDNPIYGVSAEENEALLCQAIADVEYAIEAIRYAPGDETDLNLYNTLAHAYFDLAEVLESRSAPSERINSLRQKGNAAARRVFEDDPTNSFAIETYVRNLLGRAKLETKNSAAHAIEALGILFSALVSSERAYRMAQLEQLADSAVRILFSSKMQGGDSENRPETALDVLKNAWTILTEGSNQSSGSVFEEVPESNRIRALAALGHEAGRGNVQVVKLTYELTSLTFPNDFSRQLELAQALQGYSHFVSPQLRLEFAILLYQVNRAVEGNDEFFGLRRLWREQDYVVEVPRRLHWLRDEEARVRTVSASIAPGESGRPMALVREFQNRKAPFRPEEFGFSNPRVGTRFSCRVSFGHNGPLLRPVMVEQLQR